MQTDLWLMTLIWLVPLVASLVGRGFSSDGALRKLGIFTSGLVVLLSLWAFARDASDHAFARTEAAWAPVFLGIRYHVGIDGLSAVLVPVSAGIVLAVLCAAPRRLLTASLIREVLLTESLLLGVLISLDLSILTLFWVTSLVPLLWSLHKRGERGAVRMLTILGVCSSLPMVVFVVMLGVLRAKSGAAVQTPYDLLALGQRQMSEPLPNWLGILALCGALVRMGCFPFHVWIVPLSERGPAPLTLAAFATPLGMFLTTRVTMPLFPELFAQAMPAAAGTFDGKLWRGAATLAQTDLRRTSAWLFLDQPAGAFCSQASRVRSMRGVSGAEFTPSGTVVVRTGLALLIGSIVARAGDGGHSQAGGLVGRHRGGDRLSAFGGCGSQESGHARLCL
ncbi:MAG: proton-conducting transporter membrane subunit [Polyangia bacterium]